MGGRTINGMAAALRPVLAALPGADTLDPQHLDDQARSIAWAAMRGFAYELPRSRDVGSRRASQQLADLHAKAESLRSAIKALGREALAAYNEARRDAPELPPETAKLAAMLAALEIAADNLPADKPAPRGRRPAIRAAEIGDAAAAAYQAVTGRPPTITTGDDGRARGLFADFVAAVLGAVGEDASPDRTSRDAAKRWRERVDKKGFSEGD